MGGVRQASVVVGCDRCKKDVMVTDEDQAQGYREFSSREDPDDRMFVAILNPAGSESDDADFEYVCPKCVEAISGYMDKILMRKPAKNENGEEEKKEGGEEKTASKRKSKAKKTEEKEEEPPTDAGGEEEPEADDGGGEEEPVEEPETKGEEEVEDDELFD